MTPLASLLPPTVLSPSYEAVDVGIHPAPMPKKLAETIWRGEFRELSELLLSRLGAPELTLQDLVSNKDKPKELKKITIQQWVVCFNAYVSVVAIRHPGCIQDLLAYMSIITKASLDYAGTPWLSYNAHFQRITAAAKLPGWSQVEVLLWTLYFTSAKLSSWGLEGLAVVPTPQEEDSQKKGVTTTRGAGSTQHSKYSSYTPPFPICKNWNIKNCTEFSCRFRHICMECR